MKYDQNSSMIRNESAFDARVRKVNKAPEYKVEGERVLLLTGPYQGQYVQDLWSLGTKERDYVYKWVYRRASEEVRQVIKQLFVK